MDQPGDLMNPLRKFAVSAALVVSALSAQATLVDRGGGMIYDTELNITWLQDWNYAKTSGYTGVGVFADGTMTWDAAVKWADDLVYGGFSDWRLPTTLQADASCGTFNLYGRGKCSELGRMYYDTLGNLGECSPSGSCGVPGAGLKNTGPFTNLGPHWYWLGVEYVEAPENTAWIVDMAFGAQAQATKRLPPPPLGPVVRGVAVRSGDAAVSVPEPQMLALTLTALGALVLALGRRRQ
jgi:hypothetical protein